MPAFNNRFKLNKVMGLPIAAIILTVIAIIFIGLSFSVYLTFDMVFLSILFFFISILLIMVAVFVIKQGDRMMFVKLIIRNFFENRSKPIDGVEKE